MFLFVCLFFNINTVKDMFYAGKKKESTRQDLSVCGQLKNVGPLAIYNGIS